MKLLNSFLLTFFLASSLCAQNEKDDLSDDFLLGIDYSSNTNTFGINLDQINQANYIFTGAYFSKYKFDISYSGIVTDNSDSTFTKPSFENDFSLGYTLNVSDKFIIYPSYTHLVHSKNSYALKSIFSDIAQIDALYSTKYYNGSIDISHIWGDKNMLFVSVQNALDLMFEKVFCKDDMLNLQLGFSVNISDNNYYNQLIYNDYNYDDFTLWVENNYSPLTLARILQRIDNEGFDNIKQEIYYNNPYLFEPDYKLTTIDILLPIYYSIHNIMFSVTGYLTISTATNEFYDQYTSFLFTGGVSYFFKL
jgi:hypothetical protein